MARVQLIVPDADRDRFVVQARREGMTLSAWLRAAAQARLDERQRVKRFESPEDVREFFRACDAIEGPRSPNRTGANTCASSTGLARRGVFVALARQLYERHPVLQARDLRYLASCRRRGVSDVMTFDSALASVFEAL